VEAILVTFQEPVIMRGAALRRLREAQDPIVDSEHYTLLKTLCRNCAKTSPWGYFFAAVNRAAVAPDRIGVIKQLDEAEKILLSIAQVRHQIMTGVRVSESDLRRSYLDAIEGYIQSATRAVARSSHKGSPAGLLLRWHQLANNERLNQKDINVPTEPSQQLRSKGDTRRSAKLELRGGGMTRVADVLVELRLALTN
jgi:hypothetical protein